MKVSKTTKLTKAAEEHAKAISTRIKVLQSRKEKIALVKENNPLFYVFGQTLVQRKPYEGYDEYINRLYIGDRHGNEERKEVGNKY